MNTPIPDELKAMFALEGIEERLALLQALVLPANAGELVKLSSLADDEIGGFLAAYTSHPNHSGDPDGKVRSRATFDEKIKAMALVLPKLDANPANYEGHLDFLTALRLLRNNAAHESGLHIDDASKFCKNPAMLAMVQDFPKTLWANVKALRVYLAGLPL